MATEVSGFDTLHGQEDYFFSLQSIYIGCGEHTAFNGMRMWRFFSRRKAVEA